MKEPLTLAQAEDEVTKLHGYKSFIDGVRQRMLTTSHLTVTELINQAAELYRQSFIDSLRGKIEAIANQLSDEMVDETELGEFYAYSKVLRLLNETSGETGK
jgi:hypothetical protein